MKIIFLETKKQKILKKYLKVDLFEFFFKYFIKIHNLNKFYVY